jgi:hypothetical protein
VNRKKALEYFSFNRRENKYETPKVEEYRHPMTTNAERTLIVPSSKRKRLAGAAECFDVECCDGIHSVSSIKIH